MNNEPVAWMGKDYDGLKTELYFDVERNKLPYRLYETATPLYTHPVKELTDEEILSLTGFKDNPYDIFIEYEKEDLIEFARAILRKAQEK